MVSGTCSTIFVYFDLPRSASSSRGTVGLFFMCTFLSCSDRAMDAGFRRICRFGWPMSFHTHRIALGCV